MTVTNDIGMVGLVCEFIVAHYYTTFVSSLKFRF